MTAFVALRVAAQPADQDHPYGHHKAEYFSAVIEAERSSSWRRW